MTTSPTQAPGLRKTAAEEIWALLGRRRMSATRLGEAIGRSQSYMSRRLTGELAFDLDDLERIAGVFDVPAHDLLGTVGRSDVHATRQYFDLTEWRNPNGVRTRPGDTRPPNRGPRPGGDRPTNGRTGRVPRPTAGQSTA